VLVLRGLAAGLGILGDSSDGINQIVLLLLLAEDVLVLFSDLEGLVDNRPLR
jgi:hypothetical protein